MLLDAAQNFDAVDLAENDVFSPHSGDGIEHSPAVAVKLRQRVEVDVAVSDTHVPPENGGV